MKRLLRRSPSSSCRCSTEPAIGRPEAHQGDWWASCTYPPLDVYVLSDRPSVTLSLFGGIYASSWCEPSDVPPFVQQSCGQDCAGELAWRYALLVPCYHPMPAARMASGGVSLRRCDVAQFGGLLLPCGTCVGCQKSRAQEWAIRCDLEARFHDTSCWATLTYDESCLPPTLSIPHLSGFVKRLRARRAEAPFKFFGAGEYGERFGRAHYHVILFGVPVSAPIQSCWKFGTVRVDPLSPAAIAYVAGYANKKIGPKYFAGERIDYGTGEVYEFQPPFRLMSRGGRTGLGIAAGADKWFGSWRKTAYKQYREVPVPRYLHKMWEKRATPEEVDALRAEKDREAFLLSANRYPERLEAAERIALAQLKQCALRRSL